MLDDLLTLSKLLPVPVRVLHLQVELETAGNTVGVYMTDSWMYSLANTWNYFPVAVVGVGGTHREQNRFR